MLPQRKKNRLEGYDYSTGGAYFITICTQGKRCILSDVTVGADALGGPQLRLTAAGRVVEKYILSTDRIPGLRVDKYAIMPNHVHMIVFVDASGGPPRATCGSPRATCGPPRASGGPPRASAPTEAAIPRAIGAMKRLVNRELGENIWQRSYYDHAIRGEADYREIWRYIDENPQKWEQDELYFE